MIKRRNEQSEFLHHLSIFLSATKEIDNGSTEYTFWGLNDGAYDITVRVIDTRGNEATSANSLTVDTDMFVGVLILALLVVLTLVLVLFLLRNRRPKTIYLRQKMISEMERMSRVSSWMKDLPGQPEEGDG